MKGLERGRIIAGLLAATVLVGVAAVSYRVGAGHGPVVVTGEGETVRVIGGGWHGGPPFGLFFFLLLAGARGGEIDRVLGLELGADDYLVKPFSPRELVARVRAVLRRVEERAPGPEDEPLVRGDLVVDPGRRRVSAGGRTVDLTPTEFDLLAHLARQPGRVFTRAQLLTAIHGVAVESYERAVDAHVKNLRRKLEPDPRRPRYVLTVHGVGYRLAER